MFFNFIFICLYKNNVYELLCLYISFFFLRQNGMWGRMVVLWGRMVV